MGWDKRLTITEEHYNALRDWIVLFDDAERRTNYRNGDFPRSASVVDLNRRYRWDLFWLAVDAGMGYDMHEPYTNDQFDSALKRIVPDIVV